MPCEDNQHGFLLKCPICSMSLLISHQSTDGVHVPFLCVWAGLMIGFIQQNASEMTLVTSETGLKWPCCFLLLERHTNSAA